MRESYCGKNCAECMRREELNCPGCRPEEGRRFPTSCAIAQCCNKNGHETCETCVHKQNFCQTLKEKDDYPQRHIREVEAEAQKREEQRRKMEERRERGVFLLKHFNVLCVLWAIGVGCNLIDLMAGKGTLFGYVEEGMALARLFVVYDMARVSIQYKYVALIGLAAAAVSIVQGLMGEMGIALAFLFLLLSLPGIYAGWLEYSTHSEVLWGIDDLVAAKWEKLAKWYVWTSAASIGGTFLMLLGGIFALIVLVGTIGIVVVAILGIVYLWQTRKALSLYVEANVPKA